MTRSILKLKILNDILKTKITEKPIHKLKEVKKLLRFQIEILLHDFTGCVRCYIDIPKKRVLIIYNLLKVER